jgi:hypothetical protein
MAHTVIGFFDDASDAQRAVEHLQSRGIGRDRIVVSRGSSGTDAPDKDNLHTDNCDQGTVGFTDDARTIVGEEHNTNKITDFFHALLQGDKDDGADRYSRAAQRAGAVVTVHAQSAQEADTAADAMDDAGSIDIDEREAP